MKTYYEVLGLQQNATESEIRKAYYTLARQFHPDKNSNDPTAAEKFKKIAEAYEVLNDPENKERYDNSINLKSFVSVTDYIEKAKKDKTLLDLETFSIDNIELNINILKSIVINAFLDGANPSSIKECFNLLDLLKDKLDEHEHLVFKEVSEKIGLYKPNKQKAEQPSKRGFFYEILGVSKDEEISEPCLKKKLQSIEEEIENEFDSRKIPVSEYKQKLKDAFKAYQTLTHPELKKDYDNKLLLEAALEKMGFTSELIDLEISAEDAVNKIAKGKQGEFLIRKSMQEDKNLIVFTVKNNDKVSHLRIPFSIESDEVKFDEKQQHVFDNYLSKFLLKTALEKIGFPAELIDLNISGQDAVDTVSLDKFLIRKSEAGNTIVFT